MSEDEAVNDECSGVLVWFFAGAEENGAVIECSACGFITVTGNFNPPGHLYNEMLREGPA